MRFLSTLLLIVSCLILKNSYSRIPLRVLIVSSICMVGVSTVLEDLYTDNSVKIGTFKTIFLMVLITTTGRIEMLNLPELGVFGLLGCFIPVLLGFLIKQWYSLDDVLSLFFYAVLILLRKYKRLQLAQSIYNETTLYEKKSREQEGLVSQLLPKHAFLKLRNQNLANKIELTDVIEDATLLFADIKGFTSFSNKNPA